MLDNLEMRFSGGDMHAKGYEVEVRRGLMGQLQITLIKPELSDSMGSGVVRHLTTYKTAVAHEVAYMLRDAADPELLCRSMERPWNCEHPGDRIKLDTTLRDRPELVGSVQPNARGPRYP